MRALLAAAVLAVAVTSVLAQRRITPVNEPEIPVKAKPGPAGQEASELNKVHTHDSLGNVIFVDTVTGQVDTIAALPKVSKMIYPTVYNVAVGLDLWDPVMRILGQNYGLASVWGELNMHNRYFPYLEVGLDRASDTPKNGNYTFKVKTAPFFKVGIGYNIFYNSNPDYQLKFGLRYGITRFTYQVTDVTVTDGYWGEQSTFSIPEQSTTTGYIEITAGVKVKIWRNLALGWTAKYHTVVNESAVTGGKPMIIPGYGKRNNSFTGSFSVIYTLPLNKKREPDVVSTSGKEGADADK